jgi:hypothetical protein
MKKRPFPKRPVTVPKAQQIRGARAVGSRCISHVFDKVANSDLGLIRVKTRETM